MRPRLPQRQRPCRIRGFTLIELMVVLVLIGILSATIIPQMQGSFEEALLRSTARRILNALHLARSESVTTGLEHRVRFDVAAERYVIERSATNQIAQRRFVPLRATRGAIGKIDSRITIQVRRPPSQDGMPASQGRSYLLPEESRAQGQPQEPMAVAFYPDGTTERAEVHLRDRQGFGLAIRLNPVTAGLKTVSLQRQRPQEAGARER